MEAWRKGVMMLALVFMLGVASGFWTLRHTTEKYQSKVEAFEDFGAKSVAHTVQGCVVIATQFPNDPNPRFFIDCKK